MNIKKLTVKSPGFPEVLRHIPGPPEQLFTLGAPLSDLLKRPRVAIVGTRRITPYGRQVTTEFATKLAEQGVVIISGLAYGVDTVAHRSALDAGGQAIAVLPSPLDNIVPVANRQLARSIVDKGGALVSEYASGREPFKQNFIVRNRLVSGLADAILITESPEKSGALYTANFAVDQGRDVLVVPGNVTSSASAGTNNLLKQGQAAPATSYKDVLLALGLTEHSAEVRGIKGDNPQEQTLLDLMLTGVSDSLQLLTQSHLAVTEFNRTLTMLEITGKVRPLGANHWAIR